MAGGAGRPRGASVRARIESSPRTAEPARSRWSWWPARRALVAAVLILLVLAALAGAAGLGLPGLRLILGPAPVSPPPSLAPSASPAAGAPGSTLGLGELVPLEDLDARAGFDVEWPSDPATRTARRRLHRSDAGWPGRARVAVARRAPRHPRAGSRPDRHRLPGHGRQRVLLEGDRQRDDGQVGARRWRPGVLADRRPAFPVLRGSRTAFVHDPRRWVGDALLWTRGAITYRLETSLDEAAAIRLAESMP